MSINIEDVKSIAADLIKNHEEPCDLSFYTGDGYDAGYVEGYKDGLNDLIGRIQIAKD